MKAAYIPILPMTIVAEVMAVNPLKASEEFTRL